MKLINKYKTLLNKNEVVTSLRISHLLAQLHHESNLEPIQENLNYSAARLLKIFPKYFKTIEDAKLYERQPEKIANRVYANRMGNGDEASGDGWKFRGRGFIQITGRKNYQALSNATKIDYINAPDKLLNEADSMISALWYWSSNGLNKYADKDDILTITKRINGAYNGLEHRKELLEKYKLLKLEI